MGTGTRTDLGNLSEAARLGAGLRSELLRYCWNRGAAAAAAESLLELRISAGHPANTAEPDVESSLSAVLLDRCAL